MIHCAVLGSPIEHSLSPLLHQRAYEFLGIAGSYDRFRVEESELAAFLERHKPGQWRGFSLTMPLKERALEVANRIEASAIKANAINTLVASEDGWAGFNTDVRGFASLLENLSFESVSILGAGGTARAALVALSDLEIAPSLFRRSSHRDGLLKTANEQVVIRDWDLHLDALTADLIISTLPGTVELAISSEVPLRNVIEAAYDPWPTAMSRPKTNGAYISGRELLVAQAIEQIALFTEVEFEREPLKKMLLEVIGYPQS